MSGRPRLRLEQHRPRDVRARDDRICPRQEIESERAGTCRHVEHTGAGRELQPRKQEAVPATVLEQAKDKRRPVVALRDGREDASR